MNTPVAHGLRGRKLRGACRGATEEVLFFWVWAMVSIFLLLISKLVGMLTLGMVHG